MSYQEQTKEDKKIHTIHGYPGTIKDNIEKKTFAVLKIPLKYFPLKMDHMEKKNMSLNRTEYEKLFDRMLKTETEEGLEKIPDRFFAYTLQITDEDIEFTGLFENVCRSAFVEFYYSLFSKTTHTLMFSRTYNYYGYEKKEEIVTDYPSISNMFGNDNADY
jgi:hypothetical protein